MSALAEALVAAQARAVAALGKQYVSGAVDDVTVRTDLASVGLTDEVDTDRLLAAWDILRAAGAPAPSEQGANGDGPRMISNAQRTFIGDLVKRANVPAPDLAGLTHEQASEMITSLKNGTYDPEKYAVPF